MTNLTHDQTDRAGKVLKTQIESLESEIRWTRGSLDSAKRSVANAEKTLAHQEAQLGALVALLEALTDVAFLEVDQPRDLAGALQESITVAKKLREQGIDQS